MSASQMQSPAPRENAEDVANGQSVARIRCNEADRGARSYRSLLPPANAARVASNAAVETPRAAAMSGLGPLSFREWSVSIVDEVERRYQFLDYPRGC